MRKFLLAVFLCSISAFAQVPDCSSGTCAGIGIPNIACHPGNKYARMDTPGSNYTCTGIPPVWTIDAGSGGLPSASGAGMAPLSTSAGTTYTAQSVPTISNANDFTNTQKIENAGTFTSGQANLHVQSLINGCVPSDEYGFVQFSFETEGFTSCITGTVGATTHQITAGAFYATGLAPNIPVVGTYSQGRALANTVHVIAGNDVAQDVNGLTTGVQMVGREIDVQPFNLPTAYNGGFGLNLLLYGNNFAVTGCTPTAPCNYGFSAINIDTRPNVGAQTWNRGINVNAGSMGAGNAVIYMQPTMPSATSSNNYGTPFLFNMIDSIWNGTTHLENEWSQSLKVPAGSGPGYDMLYTQMLGSTTSVPLHHVTYASYQNIDLAFIHSDSTFNIINVPAARTGATSTFTLPTGSGSGAVFPSAPTSNTVPVVVSGTDDTMGNSEITDAGAGAVVGAATGGAQGAGTINATGMYVNGVAVASAGNIPPPCLTATVASGQIATGGTDFISPCGAINYSTTESTRAVAFPRSGTISNLYVCTAGAQVGGTLVITYRLGTAWPSTGIASTALTVTVPSGGAAQCVQDTTHSFTYTAGLPLDIQLTNNGTGNSAVPAIIYAEFANAH